MKRNDEAIHGTNVWRVAQEGPTAIREGQFSDAQARQFTAEDFRFTCRGSSVYIMAMVCPGDGVLRVRSLREADASRLPVFHGIVRDVSVLGYDEKPAWTRDAQALTVDVGGIRSDLPLVLKVTVT